MSDLERITKTVDWLIFQGHAKNKRELSEKLGYTESSLSQILNGKVNLSSRFINKLSKMDNRISEEWLLLGEGEMLKSNEDVPLSQEKLDLLIYVPLISQYAQAGYLSGYADKEYIDAQPVMSFLPDHNARGNYVAFEVRGDSMDDGTSRSILEGDILISREIKRELWVNKLHIRDWEFVIVHQTEGILIKEILNHDVEKGEILVHSYNEFYEDQTISLNEVAQLFNSIQTIRKSRRR